MREREREKEQANNNKKQYKALSDCLCNVDLWMRFRASWLQNVGWSVSFC